LFGAVDDLFCANLAHLHPNALFPAGDIDALAELLINPNNLLKSAKSVESAVPILESGFQPTMRILVSSPVKNAFVRALVAPLARGGLRN
jgi:hypothetical protein